MKIRVLYFAAVRDLAGIAEEDVECGEGATIESFSRVLTAAHPAFEGRLESVRFARNEAFAKGDDVLADGDTVALIPPVAGG